MSFFDKIFGSQKKAEQPATQKPQPENAEAKMIKIEAACAALEKRIQTFVDGENKYEHKIEVYKGQAKAFLESGKKKEARVKMEQATRVQKQLDGYHLRRKALLDKKMQLEQAKMDVAAIDAMDEVQNHMRDVDVEKYSGIIDDLVVDTHETKMQQQEINDRLKALVDEDEQQEEVDDMMNQLMAEISNDKGMKVEAKRSIHVNIPQTNTLHSREEDEIAKMMAQLG